MGPNSDSPQIHPKDRNHHPGEATKPGEPTAGHKLHAEAAQEWFREAKEARKNPLKVGDDQKYTVQHGDCLTDIAARRLRTDHEKVDSHSISKEEHRLRELNDKQFKSLDSKGKKRDFLADGWQLQIYDSVHTKPKTHESPLPVPRPADAPGVPLPVPRPSDLGAPLAPPRPQEGHRPDERQHHAPHEGEHQGEGTRHHHRHHGRHHRQPSGEPGPAPGPSSDAHPQPETQPQGPERAKPDQRPRPETAPENTSEAPSPRNGTAIYDIASHTVILPNGERLEAHSGLGRNEDNPRSAAERNRGVTPQGTYDLSLRGGLFHGVQALVLNPEDPAKMHGRNGILAHTYMLGSSGQSNGCLVFRDYDRFRKAYLRGEIKRIEVV